MIKKKIVFLFNSFLSHKDIYFVVMTAMFFSFDKNLLLCSPINTAILFFFKKNTSPILKDLISSNYVDIHSHLLPGIDDGAKDIEDSKYLLNQLKDIGFQKIITTPHIIKDVWKNTSSSIADSYKETSQLLLKANETIPFKAAAEYMMDGHFFDLIHKKEPFLTLKDNYILVEMSYMAAPMQLFDILFDLQIAGYRPVLAHPERYGFYHFSLKPYEELKEAGCLFQLNLLSTVGYYGPQVAKMAQMLLDQQMIDFVGSDAHHTRHTNSFEHKIVIKKEENLVKAIANNQFFDF